MNDLQTRRAARPMARTCSRWSMLALREARARGASQAEAAVSMDVGLSVSVRLGEVETVEYQRDRGMGVTVYFGKRKGAASTADLTAARCAKPSPRPAASRGSPPRTPARDLPDPEDARDATSRTSTCRIHGTIDARGGVSSLRAPARRPRWPSTSASRIPRAPASAPPRRARVRQLARLPRRLPGHRCTASAARCSASTASEMQRDYWYSTTRDWRELEAAESIGRRQRRTRRCAGSARASSPRRRAPVLYAPDVARGLIGHFLGAIRGGSQYRRASFLLDAAGQQVFPGLVRSSRERPHLPQGARQRAVRRRRRGDARPRARRGRRAARLRAEHLLGAQARAADHGQRRRHAQPARARARAATSTAMLALMDRGLLVTELMGQGVNGVTGDYSRGAAGFWVENGAHRVSRCTRSRSPAISRTCIAASSTSATTSTCAAASAPARS